MGVVWRVSGISWGVVNVVNALLFSLSAIALYLLSRLFVARALAALAVLLLCASPVQLEAVVALRDYSRTPFIL